MKKSPQSMIGVTLLEIMLVLAIAAMVIVMSIRYYQSASNNQKIAAGLNTVTSVIAAGESVLGAKGSLATMATDALPYLPNNQLPYSPWGGQISISGADATSYSITMAVPSNICDSFLTLVKQNAKLSGSTCSGNSINVKVTE